MNFNVFVSKLQKTQVPPLITKFVSFMFNNYFDNIYFNGAIVVEGKIGNGARQGVFCPQYLLIFISKTS